MTRYIVDVVEEKPSGGGWCCVLLIIGFVIYAAVQK
jgi:hypothetical protein